MQSLFLSFKEDVTIFPPPPPPLCIRGTRENDFNKIIHLQPFCSHFSQICVHSQCCSFFFLVPPLPPPPNDYYFSSRQIREGIQGKTRAAAGNGCAPRGTWHPLRLSLALGMYLFCCAQPPRRCGCFCVCAPLRRGSAVIGWIFYVCI